MTYFVVVNEQGPSWDGARAMREQREWTEHAAYVNQAMYSGLVLLGGPLGSGAFHRALLVVSAEDEAAVQTWIREDPWIRSGILRTASVEPWTLLVSNDKLDPVLEEITKPKDSI
jgi:uncharacterized protein YciI